MRAFQSEWIKLRQRATVLGFGGAIVGFVLVATVMMFTSAGGSDVGLDHDDYIPAAALSLADGSVFPMTQMALLIGVVTLAMFASNLAGEFSRGTIRLLFVTEPNRLKVIGGKLAALASFTGLAVAVALVVSVAAGALTPGTGVDTTQWWTADGFVAMGIAWLAVTAASVMGGLIGAALAAVTRSAAVSISIGTVWIIIVEPLGSTFWQPLREWGPGAVLSALPSLDETALAASTVVALAVAYSALAVATTSVTLATRDVTS